MKVWVCGHRGKLGRSLWPHCWGGHDHKEIKTNSAPAGWSVDEYLDAADVIVDASSVEGNAELLLRVGTKKNRRVLVLVTGLTNQNEWKNWASGNDSLVVFSANTSIGIEAMRTVIPDLVARLGDFDVVIEETHHRQKKDRPSGTAKLLGQLLPPQTAITSVRGGGVFGEHKVRFLGLNEEISVTHRAFNREIFATGALRVAKSMLTMKWGQTVLE